MKTLRCIGLLICFVRDIELLLVKRHLLFRLCPQPVYRVKRLIYKYDAIRFDLYNYDEIY